MSDVEIYIKKITLPQIISWIEQKFDKIRLTFKDEDIVIFNGLFEKETIPIVITQNIENYNMMGVWFNAKITPWKSHLECAREAYQYFKLPILCDPGQDSFGPGEFILIDKNGKSIINIDEE